MLHQMREKPRIHRPIRLGHRQQARHRFPCASRVHVGDETGHLAQHRRRGQAGIGQHGGPAHQSTGLEILLRGDRGEAVALDGESQEGDSRAPTMAGRLCHNTTPNISAMRGVAFSPLPVRTSTVVCPDAIAPDASNLAKAAAACAEVGST